MLGVMVTEGAATEPLFYEQGASWYWLLAGPIAAGTMLVINVRAGIEQIWLVPLFILPLVSGFLAVQVKAARIHASVELTDDTLRQGTESLDVDDIVLVYPEQDKTPGTPPPTWQSARALGELSNVPKGRVGIGLKLTEDRTAQAWARRHQELRAALTELLERRWSENSPPGAEP